MRFSGLRPCFFTILRGGLCFLLSLSLWAQDQVCEVELFVGDADYFTRTDSPALEAKITPISVAAKDGSIYFTDLYRIRKLDPQGMITTIAGTGISGIRGDGGPAIDAELILATEMAFAPDGTLYFIDGNTHIRRILPNGTIEFVYSNSSRTIHSIDVGPNGLLYFRGWTDLGIGISRLLQDGTVELMAGGAVFPFNPADAIAPALGFRLQASGNFIVLANGDLIIADQSYMLTLNDDGFVRLLPIGGNIGLRLSPTTVRFSFADVYAETDDGDILFGDRNGVYRLSNGVGEQILDFDVSVTESEGRLYFVQDSKLWRLDPDSPAQVIAGIDRIPLYATGRPLEQTRVFNPTRLAGDSQGKLYYIDLLDNSRVLRATPGGTVEIAVGGGQAPLADGVLALDAMLEEINDIAVDAQDRLYLGVGGQDDADHSILRVESNGTVTVLTRPTEELFAENPGVPEIAVGPDGAVLFTFGGELMEFTPQGAIAPSPLNELIDTSRTNRVNWDAAGEVRVVTQGSGTLQNFDVLTTDTPTLISTYDLALEDAVGSTNGTIFAIGNGSASGPFFRTPIRISPDGIPTELLATGGFSFANGNLSSTPGMVGAIGNNPQGDLFLSAGGLGSIFVMRNADECVLNRPHAAAIVSGASYYPAGYSPGSILSVFGSNLGPENIAYGAPGQSSEGTWQTEVGGFKVLIDGREAPVIFSRTDQAAFIVPNDAAPIADIQFELNGVASGRTIFETSHAAPEIFTADASGIGQAAALNQDSSINSPDNPAARGSVIVLYITGAGLTDPPSVTGSLNAAPLPQLVESVDVFINNVPAVVEFAGPAPGLVSGVFQVNARIPTDAPSGHVTVAVHIGGVGHHGGPKFPYQPITISVQ